MIIRSLATIAILLIGATTLASAQPAAKKLQDFREWAAYTTDRDGKTCFIAAQPQKSEYSKEIRGRDPVFFMVTTIPGKNIRNEASTIIGYPFADESKVTISIDGGSTFTLFTNQDTAWVESQSQEPELIAAMRRGSNMVVQGTSRRGTLTTDTYSLSGVTAALEAIAKECP
ncbi:invasion associated locus B family protein [Bauldia sp.]|uniref:invasion associated locus B family protein n=1 Tax=Bauldia sp. TaxID=2575872 RepID=UPI003BAA4735